MNVIAFAVPTTTPARSPAGWTRGLPPPLTVSHCPRVPAVHGGPRYVPVMTAAARRPPAAADTYQACFDDDSTVASYLSYTTSSDSADGHLDSLAENAERLERGCDTVVSRRATAVATGGDTTRAVHGGGCIRGGKKAKAMADAIATPIVQSSTYTFASTKDCIDYNRGIYQSFEYGRYGNPTAREAEEKLMALEKAEDAVLTASGMNAVTTLLLALIPQNGHIVTTTDCYRRTRQFVRTIMPKMGVRTTVIDPADVESLRSIFETQGADLFFSESPTNPLLRVVDTLAVTKLCAKHGVISVIDTTFATPANYRAIDHGADLVLQSGTKYLGGHHDVLCGALAGRADLIASVRKLVGVLGGVIDPQAAYLLLRGMKTLGIRMEAHNRNAETIAQFLDNHPKVSKVHYPTLKSHRDYAVASRLSSAGFGGVLSFELKGNGDPWSPETFQAGGRFVDALQIPYIGPSLGGCESLVEQVCIMGYFDEPLRERKRIGISNGLIRFAAGIEDADDLIDDISQALDCL